MSSIPESCVDFAASNPDISGVGVRVSFYLQTFLLVLLVDRSWQDAPIALWTFIATSAGLMLAAVVLRDQLTLFQALQVSNLVWLANFGLFFALASYSRQKAASRKDGKFHRAFDYRVKFGAMVQALVSMALTLYMWANVKSFGSLRNCSYLIKYIFFVVEVPATSLGRILGLTITCILITVYLLITLQELYSYRQSYISNQNRRISMPTHSPSVSSSSFVTEQPSNPSPDPTALRPPQRNLHISRPRRPIASTIPSPQSPRQARSSVGGKRRPRRRRWSSDLDPMLVGIIICQVMVFTYFIVSTEMLLKRNPSDDHSAAQWTFGQILALIVVIPSAFSLTGAIREHGVSRLSKPKKGVKKRNRRRKKEDIEIDVV